MRDTAHVKLNNETWQSEIGRFMKPNLRKAFIQIIDTVLPYILLWPVMIFMIRNHYPYPVILVIAVLAGLLLMRTFIIFHDCCHGSFFKSRLANQAWGFITGILTFTPFWNWRWAHNVHHATSGNLKRRGIGDVWTMTLSEYQKTGKYRRLAYRLFRNPFVMFGIGPLYLFLVTMRFSNPGSPARERRNVMITNILILMIITGFSLVIGLRTYIMIQIPVLFTAGMVGIWLFYIQHQFEEAYWKEDEDWNLNDSALSGSSYYKLPGLLQWISGNIGFHHIHHLRPRIPNYHLEACNEAIPAFRNIQPMTIRRSLKSLKLNLWDEETQRMISFKSVNHSK